MGTACGSAGAECRSAGEKWLKKKKKKKKAFITLLSEMEVGLIWKWKSMPWFKIQTLWLAEELPSTAERWANIFHLISVLPISIVRVLIQHHRHFTQPEVIPEKRKGKVQLGVISQTAFQYYSCLMATPIPGCTEKIRQRSRRLIVQPQPPAVMMTDDKH